VAPVTQSKVNKVNRVV